MTWPGERQFVAADRLRRAEKALEAEVQQAVAAHEHFWVMAIAHRLSPEAAHRLAFATDSSDPALLDAETVLSVSPGCFICEEPLTRRRLKQPCPGEPA